MTVVSLGLLTVTLSGSEDGSITIVKLLLLSDMLLLIIGTSNEKIVSPAVNITAPGRELYSSSPM